MRYGFMFVAGLLCANAAQADLLCSYTARISVQDKLNSSGDPLVKGDTVSPAIAAAIIRQDRANYHEFNKRDDEDTGDCYFQSKQNRALLEKRLSKGTASKASLSQIIFGNPLISVDVYDDYMNVKIIETSEVEKPAPSRKSSIK